MTSFAVIDYDLGNLHSVASALEYLGHEAVVTSDPVEIEKAGAIVLPGVGSFGNGMQNLRDRGLEKILGKEVLEKKKPFLGICLGMQLIARESDESPGTKGLGWVNADVKKLNITVPGLKVPHMGWNDLKVVRQDPLFNGLKESPCFYFVHSYNLWCNNDPKITLATANYGGNFVAVVRKQNIFAVQFHPEKSHLNGLRLLQNFAEYSGGRENA